MAYQCLCSLYAHPFTARIKDGARSAWNVPRFSVQHSCFREYLVQTTAVCTMSNETKESCIERDDPYMIRPLKSSIYL